MSLCGIDEAGRGCLAGPLAVAGVVLKTPIAGLGDSKKLNAAKREALFGAIVENSFYHIVLIDAAQIDARGLSACMKRALIEIKETIAADRYLFDGHTSFGVAGLETMIKADATVAEVGAASILAKVSKDRRLIELAKPYPQYGFENHQGYGTAAHLQALERYGPCPLHRQSFKLLPAKQGTLF
ncbi:MAG: ribonuclease HII [Campylobacterales bacterium]